MGLCKIHVTKKFKYRTGMTSGLSAMFVTMSVTLRIVPHLQCSPIIK